MKRSSFVLITLIFALAIAGLAQDLSSPAKGTIIAPPSTLNRVPGKVHTSLYIFIPADRTLPSIPNGENPASLACIYGVVAPTSGCPKSSTLVPTGGSKAIAVVEYGTYSNVQSDLNTFSTQFGLPGVTITQLCLPSPPCVDNNGSGWDVEEALDVEYAHAMAPHAQIIISSFANDPIGDGAETAAADAVATAGGGEVSNSWTYNGGESWCGSGNCELQYDQYFSVNTVVFFGSAGDSGLGVAYPSISPNVISAGGTLIRRDSNGNFTGEEDCWNGSGGGISQYEPLPNYQFLVEGRTGPHRGTPDWAADASPASGVDIYDSSSGGCRGWCTVGGTSVASPLLAGITNQAGNFHPSTSSDLTTTYGYYKTPGVYRYYFYDVTVGSNGSPAKLGWDECTGLGTPRHPSGF
jgi:subtilase family serine protease